MLRTFTVADVGVDGTDGGAGRPPTSCCDCFVACSWQEIHKQDAFVVFDQHENDKHMYRNIFLFVPVLWLSPYFQLFVIVAMHNKYLETSNDNLTGTDSHIFQKAQAITYVFIK